jgi:hypothetical protein
MRTTDRRIGNLCVRFAGRTERALARLQLSAGCYPVGAVMEMAQLMRNSAELGDNQQQRE